MRSAATRSSLAFRVGSPVYAQARVAACSHLPTCSPIQGWLPGRLRYPASSGSVSTVSSRFFSLASIRAPSQPPMWVCEGESTEAASGKPARTTNGTGSRPASPPPGNASNPFTARAIVQDIGCVLPSVLCHLPFVVCHLSSVICHLPSAICHPPSVICHL